MNLVKSENLSKIMALFAFFCIIISLIIIIFTPQANIYEISIYNAYPWYFWLFIITSIIIGQLIIFIDVFYSLAQNRVWLLGAISILIPIAVVLLLPIIRGYPTYGFGDHLTHIGIIKDILQFGNIAQDNFYPNIHILSASVFLVSDWGIFHTANFIPLFFFLLSPVSMYIFFRMIFNKKKKMKLALIFTSAFLFFGGNCIYLAPYYQSFLLIPIIFYLYFKRDIKKDTVVFSLLFIIMLVGFTFYHPINLMLLIFVFLFFAISFNIYKKNNSLSLNKSSENKLKEKSLNIIFFSSLLFLIWYFSFSAVIKYFHKIFSSLVYGTYESHFDLQATYLSTYAITLFDIIKILFYTYGSLIVIGLLLIFALFYMYINSKRKKQTFRLKIYLLYSILSIVVFFGLITSSIFADFIVGWNRFFLWATIFSIILITFSFYSLLSDYKHYNLHNITSKKNSKTVTMCIIFVILTFLSISTFYPSPITGSANLQVTKMDWIGTEWINENSYKKTMIDQLGISQSRFYSAIYGLKDYPVNYRFEQPPDHFGYQNNTSLGEYYQNDRYIIITHLAKIRYPESYPDYSELWRFTPDDFNQLQNDNKVIKFYSNGGLESYLVKSS